jgi:hypothetical protein
MKRFETYLFITALLLVIFTSRQGAVAETRNVKVKILSDIVLCNSTEKMFNFLIDIGTVAKTDSFVGYDLWMKYDTNRVRIINMLPGNSYTEICKGANPNYVGFVLGTNTNNSLDGTFRAYGMVSGNTLLYGDRHLVAFKAIYVGPDSCGLTSAIDFEYIDFLDEQSFKGQEIVYQNAEVKVVTGDVSGNKFSIISDDEFRNEKKDNCNVNIGYKIENTKQLDRISFLIENPKPGLFMVELADNQENSDLEIISAEDVFTGNRIITYVYAKMKEYNSNVLFNLNVKMKNTVTDSVEIKITPNIEDQCNCIGSINEKSLKIVNTIPQVSVNDILNENFTIAGNNIYLNDSHKVKELYVSDMSGRTIMNITITNEKLISLNEIYNGIYFVKAKLIDDKFEIKKIIINN